MVKSFLVAAFATAACMFLSFYNVLTPGMLCEVLFRLLKNLFLVCCVKNMILVKENQYGYLLINFVSGLCAKSCFRLAVI